MFPVSFILWANSQQALLSIERGAFILLPYKCRCEGVFLEALFYKAFPVNERLPRGALRHSQ